MSVDAAPEAIVDLEAMFAEEIPCDMCSKAALLKSDAHYCPAPTDPPPKFKCLTCWLNWYQRLSQRLSENSVIRCGACDQLFDDIKSFSDYREF